MSAHTALVAPAPAPVPATAIPVDTDAAAPPSPLPLRPTDDYSSGGRQPPSRGPLRAYARLVVARPLTVLVATVVASLAAGGLVVGLGALNLTDPTNNEFLIRGNVVTRRVHALTAARNGVGTTRAVGTGSADEALRLQSESNTMWLMVRDDSPAADALTPAALRTHKRLLDSVVGDPRYPEFCWRNAGAASACDGRVPVCEPPSTVLAHPAAYGVVDNSTGRVCGIEAGDRLLTGAQAAALRDALITPDGEVDAAWAGTLDAGFSASSRSSRYLRLRVPMGAPLPGYASAVRDTAAQADAFVEWITPLAVAVSDVAQPGGVTAKAVGETFNGSRFGEVATADLKWSLAAIAFVAVFMALHMRSLFLASVAMTQILLAFPVTFMVYALICRVSFFSTLQILSIFLILGIGADDAFILADSWHQAGVALGVGVDLVDRLSWTLARAVKAMAVTSATTAAAFFITGLSAVMPISTLGVWAGLLIIVQYVLCVLMFPAALVIWQRNLRARRWARCLRLPAAVEAPAGTSSVEDSSGGVGPGAGGAAAVGPDRLSLADATPTGAAADPPAPAAGGFGTGDDGDGVSGPAAAAAAGATPLIRPGGSTDGHLPPSSGHDADTEDALAPVKAAPPSPAAAAAAAERLRPIERLFRGPWFRLVRRARYVAVAAGVALLGVGVWQTVQLEPLAEPESFLPKGHVLGEGFEWLNTVFTAAADARSQSLVSVVYGISDVDRSGTSRYEPDDLGVPVFDAAFDMTTAAAQASVLAVCDALTGDPSLVLPGGVGEASCWVRDFRAFVGGAFVDYPSPTALGDAVTRFLVASPAYADSRLVGVDGASGELVWFALQFFSVTKPFDPPVAQTASREAFGAAVARLVADAPPGVSRPYAVNEAWAFGVSQDELVLGAQRGAGLSLGVGLAVLIGSTWHLYVSLLAIICVGGVVVNVLGLAHLLGWRLGVSESVASTIVVGFSLDYIIHLGNGFVERGLTAAGVGGAPVSRAERLRDALTEYGVSILAGAATSFGAATFLWAATIVFFDKFALFVQATVVASLLWSLLIFSGGLLVLVPEEGSRWWGGDLRVIARWWRRRRGAATKTQPGGTDARVAADRGAADTDVEGGGGAAGSSSGGDGGSGGGDGGSGSGSGGSGWTDGPAGGAGRTKGGGPRVSDYTVPDGT